MKKLCFLLILGVFVYSCSGSSDSTEVVKADKKIKGIVEISGNAFVDFDLKNLGQTLNNSYDKAQYIVADSTISGFADIISDRYDWYVFNIENPASISVQSEPGMIFSAGSDPFNLISFSNDYSVSASGRYYLKIESGTLSGNYFVRIEEGKKEQTLSSDFDFVPGEVIVKFKNNVKSAQSYNLNVFEDLELKKDCKNFRVYEISSKKLLSLGSEPELKNETINKINELNLNPDVEYAEPNFIRRPNYIPNDYYNNLWNLELINNYGAFDISRGDSTITAVLDTGIVPHEELPLSRIVQGYDFIDDDSDPEDPGISLGGYEYHGTHVAGIIGAEMDNFTGISGVSPNALIMPVRIVKTTVTSQNIADGIRYCVKLSNSSKTIPEKKADVINMSFGGTGYSRTEEDAVNDAVEEGAVLVSSAGNEGRNIKYYPAGYDNVISVGAVDKNKEAAAYSNYGNFMTLTAPGGEGDLPKDSILSLCGPDENDYMYMAGTSMSAAHVSGVIALMKSINRNLDSEDIFNLIYQGKMTVDIGDNGFDETYGYGLIDAQKSVYGLENFTSYGSVKVVLSLSSGEIINSLMAKKDGPKSFSYSFDVTERGNYIIEAGIDLNNDNDFEDIGETKQIINVEVYDDDIEADKALLSF
ncbi:MAG: S8 family serine peptidase [Desulfobacteraceae bacterium]|nr:S8 family serine peptidase [Desulfobacteraceae bacterium]